MNISVNQISSLKFHLKLGSIENLKAVRFHRAKVALADLAKNIYDWESVLDMDMVDREA